MRHHFALLQSMASKGNMEDIKEYLQTVQSDLDAITPVRFCENETVNLILSSFAAKAKQSEVRLTIDAKLPDSYPFSDTELCSLLSNTLENAIHASKQITDISKRIIHLRMFSGTTSCALTFATAIKRAGFSSWSPGVKRAGTWLWHKKHGSYRGKVRRCISIFSQGWLVYISSHNMKIFIIFVI